MYHRIFSVLASLLLYNALYDSSCVFCDDYFPTRESTQHIRKDNSGAETVRVTVNLQQAVNTIDSRFVGVTIDSAQVRLNWSTLNFSSPKVLNMARALTPTFFRLGGTAADAMSYGKLKEPGNKGDNSYKVGQQPGNLSVPFNITANQWDELNRFLGTVGWDFIMDLNALKRNWDGSWKADDARDLLHYSADRNYTIVGFELGNEFNLYPIWFNTSVKPGQLAADYTILQDLLPEFPLHYTTAFLLGPETGNDMPYYQGFIDAGGYKSIRAATFHHYYFASQAQYLPYFTDIRIMDSLGKTIDDIMVETHKSAPFLPVWLSETSTAFSGGTANMSDRFVAGFLWLDKLGLCAAKGVQAVIRQDFYGYNYGLIDLDLNPNPDYWLTLLHKRIVRGPVFNATSNSTDVRAYVACANTDNFKAGGLAFSLLNPNNFSVMVELPQFGGHAMLLYLLTAGDSDGLVSKFSSLNGVKLELSGDQLPNLAPLSLSQGPVSMAPYSFGFVVLPDTKISICMEQ